MTFDDARTFPSLFTAETHAPQPSQHREASQHHDAPRPTHESRERRESRERPETRERQGARAKHGDRGKPDTRGERDQRQPPAVRAPRVPTEADGAEADFASLGLPRVLVRALRETGILTPFPIQAATIPDALAGRDVLARGQTGSGKTLAFGLPLLARIAASGRSRPRHPKGLVLVPTRELAMQVNDVLTPLARALRLFTKTAFGGAPYGTQIQALERGVDVIVATPGRLRDLIERGACSLSEAQVTVLDEADQMVDLGFLPEVTALLDQTPADAQRLLFSATLDGDVDKLVRHLGERASLASGGQRVEPVLHELQPAVATVDTMEHHALLVPARGKFEVLAAIANRPERTILFVRTQLAVDRTVEQLAKVGVRAGALHGGMSQRARTRTLAQFREGRFGVLVATNVAARGIHVDGISLVVHVDPPADPKDYLHRAGRTARAGERGTVVTLVLPRQRRETFTMLERAGVTATRTVVEPDSAELATITGARRPSGEPLPAMAPETAVRPPVRSTPSGHADRSAPGGDGPRRPRPAGARRPGRGRPLLPEHREHRRGVAGARA
jgi:superfamily II DNA/RNA helicase